MFRPVNTFVARRQEFFSIPYTVGTPASFYFFYLGMQNAVSKFKIQGPRVKAPGPDAPGQFLSFCTPISKVAICLCFISLLFLSGCAPNASQSASARAAYSMPGYGAPSKSRKVKTKKYKKPKTVREKSKSGREAAKYRRESLSF